MRSLSCVCIAVALFALTISSQRLKAEEPKLTIGSPAPELNIEHWVQKGKFKPVTKFATDKVYVVEFWATWCPPCRESMPHLAEMQAKFDKLGVQIVSISDEELDVVEKFLDTQVPQKDITYRELTKSYCLTTDPDGSAKSDYLEASNQQGIPCAFIVGKDQKIEWIGHPTDLEEPLASVVDGKWDRKAFAEELKERSAADEVMMQFTAFARKKKLNEGIKLVDEYLAKCNNPKIKMELAMTKLMVSAQVDPGRIGELVPETLPMVESDPMAIAQIALILSQDENFSDVATIKLVLAKVEANLSKMDAQYKGLILDSVGTLYLKAGDKEKAVATIKKAIEAATSDEEKDGFKAHLDSIESKKSK